MRHLTILALMFLAITAQAQDLIGKKTYRVTAYRKGSNNIMSVSNYAEVSRPATIYVPNAFTPNGDGINDTFGIKGEGVENYRMLIFNRWGEVVFESTNPVTHWDGNFKGEPVQDGAYKYEIFARGYGDHPKTGSVTLLR